MKSGLFLIWLISQSWILAHPEEVVALLPELRGHLMVRTVAVGKLLFQIKALAADAIVAFIIPEIDIARLIDLLENELHRIYVALLRRPDEVVVRYG